MKHTPPNPSHQRSPITRLFPIGIQFLLIVVVFLLYFSLPVTYTRLIAEDNWGEYTTFAGLMIAWPLLAYLFFSSKSKKRDFWLALLAIGSFLIAMEEISWGQRLLGVPTPTFIKAANFQGEITFHNIRAISPDALTCLIVSVGFAVYGFILPVLVSLVLPVRDIVQRVNLPLPSLTLSPLFVGTGYFWKFSGLVKGDEIGELFMGIALGCLAVELFVFRRHPETQRKHAERQRDTAISLIIAVMLTVGLLLSVIQGSTGELKNRLNDNAGVRLPERGHYRQAEKIFAYLEKHPELAKEDVLINKSRLLITTGRKEEGMALLEEALRLEFARFIEAQNDPDNLRRIALIYGVLGNEGSSRKFLLSSLDAYDERLKSEYGEGQKTRRSSRPSWTYLIWKKPPREKNRLLKRSMFRASTFEAMGLYNESIEEYVRGTEFAYNAYWKNKIMWGIAKILSLCRRDNVPTKRFLSWEEVESMVKALEDGEPDWCGNGKEQYPGSAFISSRSR
jgi:tetratricopeptide (TPR) repeat protein